MTISLIRLLSGEELLCSILSSTPDNIVVDDVVLLYHQVDEQRNRVTVSFAPFMPHSQGPLTINVSAIAATCEPKTQLVDQYKQAFSNIIIAPSIPPSFKM